MALVYLYRLKALRSTQHSLFSPGVSRPEFLRGLIESKPSEEIRQGYVWHIGNVQAIENKGLFFAFGRTTKSSREKYDERSGDFVEVHDDESPFTYSLFDPDLSILGIFSKSKLAPKTSTIASNLEKILNADSYTYDSGYRIEIAEISDPAGFIEHIWNAYSVISFKIQFGEPNPIDVDEDFHKPSERLLEAIGGNKGFTKVDGKDLNRKPLESLSRSAASTGNEASARVIQKYGGKPITKHLKGDSVSFLTDEFGIPQRAAEILLAVRDTYRKISRSESDD